MTQSDDRSPVVTGLGVVSPIGCSRAEFWTSLMVGTSGIAQIRSFDTTAFSTHLGGEICSNKLMIAQNGDAAIGRTAHLATTAGFQAIEQGDLGQKDLEQTGLCIGTTMGESCWLEAWSPESVVAGPSAVPAEELLHSGPDAVGFTTATLLGLRGPVVNIAGACAAGNVAIARAMDLIRSGRLERILAIGADAFSRLAFTGFAKLGALAHEHCRPFSADRDGIVLGEGAGALLIESRSSASRRNATILAEIVGYGLSCDAHHIVRPRLDGDGLLRSMRAALQDARLTPADIDYVCAHGTGTPANDSAEVAALQHLVLGTPVTTIPMSSIKALTGHGLGAASALESVACVLALEHQTIPPTWNFNTPDESALWDVVPNAPRESTLRVVVNNASAFGGNNASVIFRATD